MPLFQIIPSCPDTHAIEIEAANGGDVLRFISAHGFEDAEVWQENAYVFSVRAQGSPGSFWAIYQREDSDVADATVGELCAAAD